MSFRVRGWRMSVLCSGPQTKSAESKFPLTRKAADPSATQKKNQILTDEYNELADEYDELQSSKKAFKEACEERSERLELAIAKVTDSYDNEMTQKLEAIEEKNKQEQERLQNENRILSEENARLSEQKRLDEENKKLREEIISLEEVHKNKQEQLDKVNKTLEKEQNRNKELSQELLKLQDVITTSQNQEQEHDDSPENLQEPARESHHDDEDSDDDDQAEGVSDPEEELGTDISEEKNGYNDIQWNGKFEELLKYKEEHGDCKVPKSFSGGVGLGRWVQSQRMLNKKNGLKSERKKKLEDIGFTWKVDLPSWEDRYEELVKYQKRHGNCLVPTASGPLGNWVHTQRTNYSREKLDETREELLTRIGFCFKPGTSRKRIRSSKIINPSKSRKRVRSSKM